MEQFNADFPSVNNAEEASCEPSVTRKQFITKIVQRGVQSGGILLGAVLLDRFIVPPVYAATSTGIGTGSPRTDTVTIFPVSDVTTP